MNGIYESEAARRPNITFVDIYRTFADSGGSYADYLADPAGKTARMRAGDGIHMTLEGAKREATKVLPALEKSHEHPPPGRRQARGGAQPAGARPDHDDVARLGHLLVPLSAIVCSSTHAAECSTSLVAVNRTSLPAAASSSSCASASDAGPSASSAR